MALAYEVEYNPNRLILLWVDSSQEKSPMYSPPTCYCVCFSTPKAGPQIDKIPLLFSVDMIVSPLKKRVVRPLEMLLPVYNDWFWKFDSNSPREGQYRGYGVRRAIGESLVQDRISSNDVSYKFPRLNWIISKAPLLLEASRNSQFRVVA